MELPQPAEPIASSEPAVLHMLPPTHMDNAVCVQGDETFSASASSFYSPNKETPYKAFSTLETSATTGADTNQWTSGAPSYETGSFTGTYSCCHTVVDGNTVSGEWLQLQCTEKHMVDSFSIMANFWNPYRAPRSFVFAGSDDGVTWSALHTEHGIDRWTSKQIRTFSVSVKRAVHFYRLIVTSVHGTQSWLTIDKLRLYTKCEPLDPSPIPCEVAAHAIGVHDV